MAAAAPSISPLHLVLLFLFASSHLIISMDAVPITRTKSLMHHGTHAPSVLVNSQLEIHGAIKARMNVELNDYPGSGANNRHTPKPQAARSVCVDC